MEKDDIQNKEIETEKASWKLRTKIAVIFIGTVLLSGIAGGCTVFVLPQIYTPETTVLHQAEEEKEYVLYIGLNDKDTYKQRIPTEDAKGIVNNLCVRYVEGYTVTEAEGAWVDEKGNLTTEHTLIYSFRNAKKEDICRIMDGVLVTLNQNTILIKENYSVCTYYGAAETGGTEEAGT